MLLLIFERFPVNLIHIGNFYYIYHPLEAPPKVPLQNDPPPCEEKNPPEEEPELLLNGQSQKQSLFLRLGQHTHNTMQHTKRKAKTPRVTNSPVKSYLCFWRKILFL